MAYMIRRTPYWRNQYNLDRVMNRFMDFESEPLPSGFPLDVIESDTEYVVKASVAGLIRKRLKSPTMTTPFPSKAKSKKKNKDSKKASITSVSAATVVSIEASPCLV